jgi:hypothetical protein
MATQLEDTQGGEASTIAVQRFRDAMEGRATGYPQGAIFVASDAPYARKTLVRAMREGQAVVLIFPDGQERVVRGEIPRSGRRRSGVLSRLFNLRSQ